MDYSELKKANETIRTTPIKGKEYAGVNERIRVFRMLYPEGTIITEILSIEGNVVVMKATASNDGKILGVGHAFEEKNSSFINKTSYIENCETSAVGRALAMLGIGIDTSIASSEEVQNAQMNQGEKSDKGKESVVKSKINKTKTDLIRKMLKEDGIDEKNVCKLYKIKSIEDMTESQFSNISNNWDKMKEKCK